MQKSKADDIKRQADLINMHSENFLWQISQLVQASRLFKNKNIRAGAAASLKGYLVDYHSANAASGVGEINVELPIDRKIPFNSRAARVYASHVGLLISAINFCRKEFGKAVVGDLGDLLNGLSELFGEAVEVYKTAQTSFERTGKGGLGIKFIRLVDNNKNACPSLHVEIVGYIHCRLNAIINAHAPNPRIYQPIKDVYFQKSVRILEAVLLVKQHVVMDIALGLALLSSHKDYMTKEQADNMVNAMFQHDYFSMDTATILEVRAKILSIYDDAAARIQNEKNIPANIALISYLRDFAEESTARQPKFML
ncbi:MAG: hypothetical protein P4L74_02840 [Candidatus Doudnabacteria bacterium]|nr:hypothetical protein [Candidatus Doudnabacteria bacterium]